MANNFEAKHPRATDGKFTEKTRKESGLELTLGPGDWGGEDTASKASIPEGTGAAGDTILEQMESDDPDTHDGLYGQLGWVKKTGAADALAGYMDEGEEGGDYHRFSTLDIRGAEKTARSAPLYYSPRPPK